jgi:hypothetical protein
VRLALDADRYSVAHRLPFSGWIVLFVPALPPKNLSQIPAIPCAPLRRAQEPSQEQSRTVSEFLRKSTF